jgi:hypothetical protein
MVWPLCHCGTEANRVFHGRAEIKNSINYLRSIDRGHDEIRQVARHSASLHCLALLTQPRHIHKRTRSLLLMMRLLIFLGAAISITVHGQALERSDLLKIMEIAFDQKLLPRDVILKWDTLSFVVIRSDKEVEDVYSIYRPAKITLWNDEQIFLTDIKHWVIPTSITRSGNKAKIVYRTLNVETPKNMAPTCHTGLIHARMKQGTWKLTKSAFSETKCEYNWGPKK